MSCGILLFGRASIQDRYPRPEFQSGYRAPSVGHPPAPSWVGEAVDVAVLAAALGLAAWLVLKRRSRKGVFALGVFSAAYFGFWRQGCVCPVGSVQNVAAALAGSEGTIPWTVAAFFLLPILFALAFGRVFCAAVCPLGAVQELVLIRPLRLSPVLVRFLGVVPYAYLGVAVLLAALGAEYLICRFDPFVGFFRLGASFGMLLFGGILLALGTVIGRPYCRFLCPYGVLLKGASLLSRRHATTTPGTCVRCRLCENACPFDCLQPAAPEGEPEPPRPSVRRLGWILAGIPLFGALGAGLGVWTHGLLAGFHPTVALEERVRLEAGRPPSALSDETRAFWESRTSPRALFEQARSVRRRFLVGGALLGIFLGWGVAGRLWSLEIRRRKTTYEPLRGDCFSCARCFGFCPVPPAGLTPPSAGS